MNILYLVLRVRRNRVWCFYKFPMYRAPLDLEVEEVVKALALDESWASVMEPVLLWEKEWLKQAEEVEPL